MGFLSPLFLGAVAVVTVPILIHLLHRRSRTRHPFPAIRYLRKTEREHARRIRFRQILLLILRVAAILLLVAAGARLFFREGGAAHEPTALAIILDNSLSSGVILDDERMLDRLKRVALESVEATTPQDRVWVVRAGEPWEIPVPGGAAEARLRIEETEVTGANAALASVVARARSLVAGAGMPAAEVHLFSDLQASAFGGSEAGMARMGSSTGSPVGSSTGSGLGADPGSSSDAEEEGGDGVPVLVLAPSTAALPANRFLASVEVGGGLPPLLDQSTRIAARVERDRSREESDEGPQEGPPEGAREGDTTRVRLVLGDQVVAAADAPAGATVLLPAGPFALGEVTGTVEIDPDGLRMDDRRYFSFRVRPPPVVSTAGDPGLFVEEALAVLEDGRRLSRLESAGGDVLISSAGEGLASRGVTAAIVLPPDDAALLPAANLRLRQDEIPWRFEADPSEGEVALRGGAVPVEMDAVRVSGAYRLVPLTPQPDSSIRIRRATGEPWMVSGTTPDGAPFLLLASALRPSATNLPISTQMIPLLEWMISGWSASSASRPSGESLRVGDVLLLPASATAVRSPAGALRRVDGAQPFRATGSPGIYEILAGDSVVSRIAVNAPAAESRLQPTSSELLAARVPSPLELVEEAESWSSRIFLERRGGEPWRLLLLAALLVLAAEGLLAAGGSGGSVARGPAVGGTRGRKASERTRVA